VARLRAYKESERKVVGGVDQVAQILNNIDRASEETILGFIEENNPEIAESIAQEVGIDTADAGTVIEQLAPLLMGAAKQNFQSSRDSGDLLKQIQDSQFSNMIDAPKKAVEKGLKTKSHVKTSLAPGSRAVTDYLKEAGLLRHLEALGFNIVGYGFAFSLKDPKPPSCIR